MTTEKPTHALTMNGRIHVALKSRERSDAEELRRRVHLLDGVDRYSLILWRLPDGVEFDGVNLDEWPQEYIQAAGGGDRFTIEERRLHDGKAVQLILGRDDSHDGPGEQIVWNGVETAVRRNEVWTSDEVAEIFAAYYAEGRVPTATSSRAISV